MRKGISHCFVKKIDNSFACSGVVFGICWRSNLSTEQPEAQLLLSQNECRCGVKAIIWHCVWPVYERGQDKTSVDFDCRRIDFPCCAHIFTSTSQTDDNVLGLSVSKQKGNDDKKRKNKIDATGNRCASSFSVLHQFDNVRFFRANPSPFGRKSVVSISHFTSILNGNSNTEEKTHAPSY